MKMPRPLIRHPLLAAAVGCLTAAVMVALRPRFSEHSPAHRESTTEAGAGRGAPDPGFADSAGRLLQILEYVSVDYREAVKRGRILDRGEYEEQVEFLVRARDILVRFPASPLRDTLFGSLRLAAAGVDGLVEPAELEALLQGMIDRILATGLVAASPGAAPDLARGKQLFAARCAVCHGEGGRGDGPAGRGLNPPPADFHDRERMDHASPLKLFHAIRYGVEGTAMPSFAALPEMDAWDLAYFVRSLGAEPAVAGARFD